MKISNVQKDSLKNKKIKTKGESGSVKNNLNKNNLHKLREEKNKKRHDKSFCSSLKLKNAFEVSFNNNKSKKKIAYTPLKKGNHFIEEDQISNDSNYSTLNRNYNVREVKKKKKLMVKSSSEEYKYEKFKKEEPIDSGLIESSPKKSNLKRKLKKKKMKMLDLSSEEYKPGMLSDSIQIRKFGRVLIPWDPSFGLDKSYSIPINKNDDLPKLKINPLFDLSKRKDRIFQSLSRESHSSIFVGNLPKGTHISDINKLFKKFGQIHQIKLKKRNCKIKTAEKNHVDAVVTFKELKSCERALKLNGYIYKDRHLRVKDLQNTGKSGSKKSVFVGNLHFDADDEDLWKAFENCGDIEDVRVIRNEITGKGKGYGYINFKAEEAVEKALELNGLRILERDIRVKRNEFEDLSHTKSDIKRKKKKKKKKTLLQDSTDKNESGKKIGKQIKANKNSTKALKKLETLCQT